MKGISIMPTLNQTITLVLLWCAYTTLISADTEPKEDSDASDMKTVAPALVTTIGNASTTAIPKEKLGFVHAFVASISVILVSEIGDKTFFIAAIMAMRHPRLTVFAGAIGALVLMTILSALFGWLANVIPRAYTFYISTALFAIFGLKMLKEGCSMSATEGQEELEEVQMDLRKKDEEFERESMLGDAEAGTSGTTPKKTKKPSIISAISRVFFQSFTLTFLAEWGDRSQLTTIILGARENVYGVIMGGVAGHAICTGLAVVGGRMIAQKISVRTVTIIGGIVFLIFAFSAIFFDPNGE